MLPPDGCNRRLGTRPPPALPIQRRLGTRLGGYACSQPTQPSPGVHSEFPGSLGFVGFLPLFCIVLYYIALLRIAFILFCASRRIALQCPALLFSICTDLPCSRFFFTMLCVALHCVALPLNLLSMAMLCIALPLQCIACFHCAHCFARSENTEFVWVQSCGQCFSAQSALLLLTPLTS